MAKSRIYFPGVLWQFYDFARPILEPAVEVVVEPERVYSAEEIAEVFGGVEGALLTAFEKVPRAVIEAAPRLRALSKYGTGVEAIDLEAATEHGIPVTNTPGANSLGVAEHTVALILSVMRQVPQLDRMVRANRWNDARRIVGGDVEGSVLGLVGFGNIGQLVCGRAIALGMCVLAYDPYQSDETIAALGAEKVGDLDDLLEASDIVSLHMTVTAQTRGLFNAERFSHMKEGAFFVNTARATLVDQQALIDVLKARRLAAAALDVFEPEPLTSQSPLLELENLIITPHHAGTTARTRERTLKQAAANLVLMLNGKLPEIGLCNPAVRARFEARFGSAFKSR